MSATELWSNLDNSIQFSSPVLKDGLIFGLSARDALFCIIEKDGKTAWTSHITGKRGFGSIVNAGTALFLLTPAGNLVAIEPSDKEFKQPASYKVADGDTTAGPIRPKIMQPGAPRAVKSIFKHNSTSRLRP